MKKICPIINCGKRQWKVKRHIQSCHSNVSNACINFAVSMSNVISMNDGMAKLNTETSTKKYKKSVKKVKRYKLTNQVSRKGNYKCCFLCKQIVKNITDHIQQKHKIPKSDLHYRDYIAKSNVVPSCYIKKINNSVVMLTGDELAKAKIDNESEIQKQMGVQNKLNILRKEIDELNVLQSTHPNDEQVTTDVANKMAQFKSIRYQDQRVLPANVKLWSSAFVEHLKDKKYSDADRRGNIALDVLLFSNKQEPTLTNITDGRYIHSLLQNFSNSEDISASTKLKYIGIFKSFVTFIAINSLSPEYTAALSNSELVSRKFKMQDVYLQIDTICCGLKKDLPIEKATNKMKNSKNIINQAEMDTFFEDSTETITKCLKDDIEGAAL